MNQKGFATLEVILMVVVIGILATIAVPRFTDITAQANTAKIKSDLATIDTALDMWYMEKTTAPSKLSDLAEYIKDADKLEPPTGSAYIGNKDPEAIPTGGYIVNDSSKRAKLGEHTAGDFYKGTE